MTHHRRPRAVLAALTAAAIVLQPTGAWAETYNLQPNANSYIGDPGQSTINGSPNGDLLFGDPVALVGAPAAMMRASTGYGVYPSIVYDEDANAWSSIGSRYAAAFSPDGKRLVFYSPASNIITSSKGTNAQAYSRALDNPADTVLISKPIIGTAGNADTLGVVYSPDGSKMALVTKATNLAGATGGSKQIVVVDLRTGINVLISKDRQYGTPGHQDSDQPVFSPDSRRVAFSSYSTLVPNDTNSGRDIYIVDIGDKVDSDDYKTIRLVSANAIGASAMGDSSEPIFSPDGFNIVFKTSAMGLLTPAPSGSYIIVIKSLGQLAADGDNLAGPIAIVSAAQNGTSIGCISTNPAYAPDGRSIAFANQDCAAGNYQILLKNLDPFGWPTNGSTRLLSHAFGIAANGSSIEPAFSPDGTIVAFASKATNLQITSVNDVQPPPDAATPYKIFVRSIADNPASAAVLVSKHVNPNVLEPNDDNRSPIFSPDGRKIAFNSEASNLLDFNKDKNGFNDVYVVTLPAAPNQGSDFIDGLDGNDRINGAGGNDKLTGGRGDDHLHGGGGTDDRALYPRPPHRYEITRLPTGSIRVRDLATNAAINQGTDVLSAIHQLEFTAPGAVSLIQSVLNLHEGIANSAPTDSASIRIKAGMTSPPFIAATDPDGDPLTISLKTPPAHGSATVGADGMVTYTAPTGSAVKSTSFVLAASDPWGGSSDVTVTVGIGVTLRGTNGANRLNGGPGNDILIGRGGRDLLRGRAGADVFRFDRLSDSRPGPQRDVILDFRPAQGDKIDLSRIDANTRQSGKQPFVFIGGRKFNGTPGQLRFKNGILSADVNGNRKSDFEIEVRTNAPVKRAQLKL